MTLKLVLNKEKNMILAIYGNGGHGLDVEELAKVINQKENRWDKIVFVDDTPEKIDNEKVYSFDTICSLYKPKEMEFMVGLGEPIHRKMLFNKIKEKGYNLATLIHPLAFVGSDVRVGEGSMICFSAYVSVQTYLGENVLIQPMATIGHECKIGNNSVVSSSVSIGGKSSLGDNSYIGLNACVKEKMKIGSGTVIGLGSAVVHDIPDGVLAVGYPARPIKNEDVRAF